MTATGADEASPPLHRRRSRAWALICVALALVASSCGSAATTAAETERAEATQAPTASSPVPAAEASTPSPAASTVSPSPAAEPTPTTHPLTVADTELPPAPIGFDQLSTPQGAQPVSIEIANINVSEAAVIAVGVNADDLSFEVPPADQVGWYEFGPRPGEPGSSVLAAHIAYNGVDGVFRYLEDVEVGSIVVVGFDDGSTSRYRIEEVTEYVKEELPDSLFARDGREQLALITCGGSFNEQFDSYESNTVAIAVPIVG